MDEMGVERVVEMGVDKRKGAGRPQSAISLRYRKDFTGARLQRNLNKIELAFIESYLLLNNTEEAAALHGLTVEYATWLLTQMPSIKKKAEYNVKFLTQMSDDEFLIWFFKVEMLRGDKGVDRIRAAEQLKELLESRGTIDKEIRVTFGDTITADSPAPVEADKLAGKIDENIKVLVGKEVEDCAD